MYWTQVEDYIRSLYPNNTITFIAKLLGNDDIALRLVSKDSLYQKCYVPFSVGTTKLAVIVPCPKEDHNDLTDDTKMSIKNQLGLTYV
jgi:hypothetical protein